MAISVWYISLRFGDAYMCHRTGSPLDQIMACYLFGTKLLSGLSTCCQLDHKDHISMNLFYLKFKFLLKKIPFKMSPAKWWSFCLCLKVISATNTPKTTTVWSQIYVGWPVSTQLHIKRLVKGCVSPWLAYWRYFNLVHQPTLFACGLTTRWYAALYQWLNSSNTWSLHYGLYGLHGPWCPLSPKKAC